MRFTLHLVFLICLPLSVACVPKPVSTVKTEKQPLTLEAEVLPVNRLPIATMQQDEAKARERGWELPPIASIQKYDGQDYGLRPIHDVDDLDKLLRPGDIILSYGLIGKSTDFVELAEHGITHAAIIVDAKEFRLLPLLAGHTKRPGAKVCHIDSPSMGSSCRFENTFHIVRVDQDQAISDQAAALAGKRFRKIVWQSTNFGSPRTEARAQLERELDASIAEGFTRPEERAIILADFDESFLAQQKEYAQHVANVNGTSPLLEKAALEVGYKHLDGRYYDSNLNTDVLAMGGLQTFRKRWDEGQIPLFYCSELPYSVHSLAASSLLLPTGIYPDQMIQDVRTMKAVYPFDLDTTDQGIRSSMTNYVQNAGALDQEQQNRKASTVNTLLDYYVRQDYLGRFARTVLHKTAMTPIVLPRAFLDEAKKTGPKKIHYVGTFIYGGEIVHARPARPEDLGPNTEVQPIPPVDPNFAGDDDDARSGGDPFPVPDDGGADGFDQLPGQSH